MKLNHPALFLCVAILLATVLSGCVGPAKAVTATSVAGGLVTGVVVSAEGTGIADLRTLEIRDEQGKVWSFVGDGFVGKTPSHLKQHVITGVPVVVTYKRRADGALLVTRVEDGTLE